MNMAEASEGGSPAVVADFCISWGRKETARFSTKNPRKSAGLIASTALCPSVERMSRACRIRRSAPPSWKNRPAMKPDATRSTMNVFALRPTAR